MAIGERESSGVYGERYPLTLQRTFATNIPSYLFLAASDPSSMTGQVLHPNGGRIVNG